MFTNDAWANTPRQYRPHGYPQLPLSTSMSSINEEPYPENRHIPTFPSYSRRRTDHNIPLPRPSYATAASSRLTASVSSNDISQPSPRFPRSRLVEIQNTTPSRIPTPLSSKSPIRFASTPVLPSQKNEKENMQPKTLRLLGPISPTRNHAPPRIPKSRTMGMLSNLTASFSRSNLNLSGSRQTSGGSTRSTEANISTNSSSSPPLPIFATDPHQIGTAQVNSYWSGRFQSLNDRFRNETFEESLRDAKIMKQYLEDGPPSPIPKATFGKAKGKGKGKSCVAEDGTDLIDTCSAFLTEDGDRRMQRVFIHLETLCITSDAKKSLWDWQLAYARKERNEKLLPTGGKMSEERSWVSRMGKVFSGSSDSTGTLGRKTGLGFEKRKGSILNLMNEFAQKSSNEAV